MKILEKIIKFGLYLAFILPLVFTSRTMYPLHFGKTVLFQILIEVLLVLALLYLSFKKDKSLIKLNKLDWSVLIFSLVFLISAFLGVNFEKSFWGNQQRAQGVFTLFHFTVFYFLLRQFFQEKKEWINLLIWVVLISFASCVLAWLANFFGILPDIIPSESRLSGLIGNPIFFASYLVLPTFFSFYLYFSNIKNKKYLLFLLIGLVNLATLLSTQARGAFVGVLAGCFIAWVLYLFFGKDKKIKKTFAISGASLIVLFGALFIFNSETNYLKDRVPKISRMLAISAEESTASTRIMAWGTALKGFKDKPLFGWGAENFQDAFDKHYNPDFLRYSFHETVWDKPHNYFLEILISAGIAGGIAYLLIVFFLLYYLFSLFKKSEDKNTQLAYLIVLVGVIACIVQNLFAFETSNSLQLWFFLLAFAVFLFGTNENQSKNIEKKILPWIALLCLILVPVLVYKNFTFYKASVCMGDARDAAEIESLYLWQKNAVEVLDKKVPFLDEQAIFLTKDLSEFDAKQIIKRETLISVKDKMSDVFEEKIENYPESFVLRFWAGQFYGFLGEYVDNEYYQRGDELLKEAWEINKDRQSVALVLAKSYLLQKKTEKALEVLEYLIEEQGEFSELHWFYGLALQQKGEDEKAIEELEKGLSFAKNRDNNLLYMIEIYAERKEYGKIILLYESLIKRNPLNSSLYASLAATYAALGDEENTILNLNKAVELNPELAEEARNFLEQNNIDINKYK